MFREHAACQAVCLCLQSITRTDLLYCERHHPALRRLPWRALTSDSALLDLVRSLRP